MAIKRITAFFFNEKYKEKLKNRMRIVAETKSIIVGDVEEKDLRELEKEKGIVINEITKSEKPETPGRVKLEDFPSNLIAHREIPEFLDFLTTSKIKKIDETKTNVYIVQLKGPLVEEWKKELNDFGIKPIERLGSFSFTAKLAPNQAQTITKKLSFVDDIRVYDEKDTNDTMSDILSLGKGAAASDISLPKKYDIVLHLAEDKENVLNFCNSNNIKIIDHAGKKIRCEFSDTTLVKKIKQLPEVALVETTPSYKFHCDISKLLIGIDLGTSGSEIKRCIEEEGDGQIICLADNGIYRDHPDLKSNIVDVKIWGEKDNNRRIDGNGHGTHIAGILVGNGSESKGKISGVAPKAKLFFQSLETKDDSIQLKLSETTKLLDEAYNLGARICNYSFGTDKKNYAEAYEVDEFILNHPDMLIIRSVGNEAKSANGIVHGYSLDGQATFKNGLSIGASQSIRKDGPNRDTIWKEWNPDNFPNDPIASQKVCGNKDCLAAFSGRGPALNSRIKPDIVAPGVDILSTRSLHPETTYSMRDIYENQSYVYKSGTSFSAPIVAGCAALIREYYIKKRNHYPSAALLKATIINGTTWLMGQDAIADHAKLANIHQGFGLINIQQSIPNKCDPDLKLEYVDSWKDSNLKFNETGQRYVFEFSNREGGGLLRLCMAYTDGLGGIIQNNLSLLLECIDPPDFWIGNAEVQKFGEAETIKTDIHNNVETIRLENPLSGTYRIHVVAWDIIKPSQDFSLVLTGKNISSLSYLGDYEEIAG